MAWVLLTQITFFFLQKIRFKWNWPFMDGWSMILPKESRITRKFQDVWLSFDSALPFGRNWLLKTNYFLRFHKWRKSWVSPHSSKKFFFWKFVKIFAIWINCFLFGFCQNKLELKSQFYIELIFYFQLENNSTLKFISVINQMSLQLWSWKKQRKP